MLQFSREAGAATAEATRIHMQRSDPRISAALPSGVGPRRLRMYRRHLGKVSNVVSVERIIAVSRLVPNGAWTTYAEVGEIVYGHRRGGQSIGNAMRAAGHADSEHRILQTGGKVSPHWRGDGSGPEECIRRLRNERAWDERRHRARAERFVNADELRRLGA